MKLMKKMAYFDTGPFPIQFGFTNNPAAFAREMKRLNVQEPPEFAGAFQTACTHTLENPKRIPSTLCIVTLTPKIRKGVTTEQINSLLTHEAVHVWQKILEAMRERGPVGVEIEAYTIQWLTQCMAVALRRAQR